MGEFHQMIYPWSEMPTLFGKLVLDLSHSRSGGHKIGVSKKKENNKLNEVVQ